LQLARGTASTPGFGNSIRADAVGVSRSFLSSLLWKTDLTKFLALLDTDRLAPRVALRSDGIRGGSGQFAVGRLESASLKSAGRNLNFQCSGGRRELFETWRDITGLRLLTARFDF
jgi:hypothetical protein